MLDFIRNLWMFAPPVCILTGTVGNVLTLITVTSKRCMKNSFAVYLGALAVADLASLYVIVLSSWLFLAFGIDTMQTAVSCKFLGFMFRVCKMWPSILVATISVDRMLVTCCPRKRDWLGSPKSAMIVTSIILGFLLIINVHELYGFKLITVDNVTLCGVVDESYATFIDVYFTWVDTSIYFIVPTIAIIGSNILTVREVINSTKRAGHLMNVEAVRIRIQINRQIIVMAVVVSVAFILLTSPRGIYTIIRPYLLNDAEVFYIESDIDFIVSTITSILASFNFSVNFFLNAISGSRFREDLKAACSCGRSSPGGPPSYATPALHATATSGL